MSATDGGYGNADSPLLNQKKTIENADMGEGGQKSQIFADIIICEHFLRLLPS